MIKRGIIGMLFFSIFSLNAQDKATEKRKDSVRTEVVEVITTYNPKIADAKKIKKNPIIELFTGSEKKKLSYAIFSVPVASTFIPKSGVVKGIDVGVKERIYDNYIAAGFGNYSSPFTEVYIHHSTRFENEFGLSAKYLASLDNIKNTQLESSFSNLNMGLFYKQEDRYFDWKVSFNSEMNSYNWYGLPDLNFTESTLSTINPSQKHNYFNLASEFNFIDSYIDFGKISFSYFTDDYESTEILINFDAKIDFPLDFLNRNFNDITLNMGFEFLNGGFENNYTNDNPLKYSIFTTKLNPEYNIKYKDFHIKIGLKSFLSLDTENDATNILLFPDIHLEKSIIKNYVTLYGGFTGNLHTNSYKSFSDENSFVSPTLFITQTAETSHVFLGFNGKLTNELSFNFKASLKEEEDKPLFLRNNSKSDSTTNSFNNIVLKGYEYGNSFGVFYDDLKTTSFFAEIDYDLTKRMTVSTQIQYDKYSLTNALESWNLPTMQASILGKYKNEKWFATTNIFYVGERKDVLYTLIFPNATNGIQTLDSFIDVNLNGGYNFNDKFSAFLKLNNVLNTNYQRFANFNVQGFQVLGGFTYKFDF